jgi:hypothetical protein
MLSTSVPDLAESLPPSGREGLQEFAEWLVDTGVESDEGDEVVALAAAIMLTFTSPTHRDHRRWMVADLLPLAEEIVERFEVGDVLEVLPACSAYFAFLHATGQLDASSDRSDVLIELWHDTTRSIVETIEEAGDLDEDTVELPARAAPDAKEVAAAAADAPILVAFARLLEAIDGGASVATLADTTFEGTAAPGGELLNWAAMTGAIEPVDETDESPDAPLRVTSVWRYVANEPVEALDEIVVAMWDLGPTLLPVQGLSLYGDEVDEFLDVQTLGVLALAYVRRELELSEAASMLEIAVSSLDPFADQLDDPIEQARFAAHVAERLALAVNTFVEVGLVSRVEGAAAQPTKPESIAITAYGEHWCQRTLSSYGYIAPVLLPFTATAADSDEAIVMALAEQMTGGPEAFDGALDMLGGTEWLLTFIPRVWRVVREETEMVLVGIDAVHQDKAVRKASRKALMQHHSAGHNWG